MSGDINIKVELKEKEKKDKTELLKDIFYDNKMNGIIKRSVLTESWGSRFAWKISNDSEVSDYPIIEMYTPFDYECVYKRGRLQAIIFKNKYEYEKDKYELQETYGKGFIDYKLYKISNNKYIEVALTELQETAELKRVDFKPKVILASEKCLDKSDYSAIIIELDALDEAWSQLMDEIRLGRSEVYVPANLLTNKTFDRFRKKYVKLGTDERENGKNEIKHIQPEIRSEEYSKTVVVVTNNILINVGLSPFTIGIADNVGANSSGDSLEKREMASLRTREEMIKDWTEFLEDASITILTAYDIFNKKAYTEYDVDIEFGKYISPTQSEIIENAKKLKEASIIDTEKALDDIYGDSLDEEEKLRIIANTGELSFKEEPVIEEENVEEVV
jgi:hypothetical protein